MNGKRKKVEEAILTFCDDLCSSGINRKYYEGHFKSLDDKAFDRYMHQLANGEDHIHLTFPNLEDEPLSKSKLDKVAKKYGVEYFKHVWTDEGEYRTKSAHKHLVIDFPLRLLSQLWSKKSKIPKVSTTPLDKLTGQPINDARGARLSKIELSILSGLGLEKTLLELSKLRGGDTDGYNALSTLLTKHGSATLEGVEPYSGEVKSKVVLSINLIAMHINNNL